MEGENLHQCTEFDQLNTCVECGTPKNDTTMSRFSGGAGASRSQLSDEDYSRQMRKLQRSDN